MSRDAAIESPRDAGESRDASFVDRRGYDAGRPDAGPPQDAGPPPDAGVPCAPATGLVGISEVMISSRSGSGDRGEWFEVRNSGDCSVLLAGLAIVSPAADGNEKVHVVTGGLLYAGDSFVFALSALAIDNHGVPFDYAYGAGSAEDVVLDNGSDWLELRYLGASIDRVTWPNGGFTSGAARQFPAALPLGVNDDWGRWCSASALYSTTGGVFYGTPGVANDACP
jgi:hypothetical protein